MPTLSAKGFKSQHLTSTESCHPFWFLVSEHFPPPQSAWHEASVKMPHRCGKKGKNEMKATAATRPPGSLWLSCPWPPGRPPGCWRCRSPWWSGGRWACWGWRWARRRWRQWSGRPSPRHSRRLEERRGEESGFTRLTSAESWGRARVWDQGRRWARNAQLGKN